MNTRDWGFDAAAAAEAEGQTDTTAAFAGDEDQAEVDLGAGFELAEGLDDFLEGVRKAALDQRNQLAIASLAVVVSNLSEATVILARLVDENVVNQLEDEVVG